MAYSATQEILRREAELQKSRSQQIADRALSDLARQYGISEEQLNANLEGRGIFRSGEAGTARARLSAENQARRSDILQDLQYSQQMTDIDLLKQLASLQARSTGNSTGNNSFDTTKAKAPYAPIGPTLNYSYTPLDPKRGFTSSEDRRVGAIR